MKNLRRALEQGEVLTGIFALMSDPTIVEMIGHVGFDFVIIDTEEASADPYGMELEQLIRAAEAADVIPMVRTADGSHAMLNKSLNVGARALLVPHVVTGKQAMSVVLGSRYPPRGVRGAAPIVRAARYGATGWHDYHREAITEPLVMVMVEDDRAIQNIDDIVATPGLDGVLVGTWDLAVDLGIAGDYGPPPAPVLERVERVFSATRGRGLYMAAHCWDDTVARKYVELGCQMIIISTDTSLLSNATRDLKGAFDRASNVLGRV